MRLDWSVVARAAMLVAVSPGLAAGARAGEKKGQAGQNSSETVDGGSFGVVIRGQRVATVLPNNEFLLEKISTPSSSKPAEQPFLMANTSAILDNNFFVHREVQVWRYLAPASQLDGSSKVSTGSEDFGVLVPQDRSSMHVRLELVGQKKYKFVGLTAFSWV